MIAFSLTLQCSNFFSNRRWWWWHRVRCIKPPHLIYDCRWWWRCSAEEGAGKKRQRVRRSTGNLPRRLPASVPVHTDGFITDAALRMQRDPTQAPARHQGKASSLMVCSATKQAICFALWSAYWACLLRVDIFEWGWKMELTPDIHKPVINL